jgi:hypothetical protein
MVARAKGDDLPAPIGKRAAKGKVPVKKPIKALTVPYSAAEIA